MRGARGCVGVCFVFLFFGWPSVASRDGGRALFLLSHACACFDSLRDVKLPANLAHAFHRGWLAMLIIHPRPSSAITASVRRRSPTSLSTDSLFHPASSDPSTQTLRSSS
ncbi:hypothetical protein VTJ04DRAFT_361 [Mycothermus thermophilus]|uniref:uncharacterized protein n=1 Tax=Humicola insolens TaxID=85995 RepID=UPI0037445AEE